MRSIDLTLSYNIAAYFPLKYYQKYYHSFAFLSISNADFLGGGCLSGLIICYCVTWWLHTLCVCVFPSTVKASGWTKTINVMPGIRPAILRWGNYSVSSSLLHCHVIDNHSRDIQASNCARVSIKPGAAIKCKIELLELSKNQW